MKKILMTASSLSIIMFGAWTFGAILYMAFVANYYRNTERRETSVQNHPSNRRTSKRTSGDHTSGLSPDTTKLLLAEQYENSYKPRTVQRDATGRYDGNKLW